MSASAVFPSPGRRWRGAVPLLSVILVSGIVLFALRDLWLPAETGLTYPWGSDTLGHLIKAEYLQKEIGAGSFYPNLFPDWYNGLQMLRYYPPLPYYLLVVINLFSQDMLAAGHLFIVLTALITAWSVLAFARWVGWGPATLGAMVLALAPDNLRVALAEGNLPRALASALLPGLTYCLVCILAGEGRRRHAVAGAFLVAMVILSHAMMGAIFGASLGVLAIVFFLLKGGPPGRLLRALGMLAIGLLLSGVWLLPSLSGGISELNQEAVTEALAVFPLTTYLNPLLRFDNHEVVYIGLGLVVIPLLGLLRPAGRRPLTLGFLGVGLVTMLISTPGFNALFNGLPAHQLFWPIRFLSFSSLALVMAIMLQLATWPPGAQARSVMLAVALLLALDVAPSLGLVFRRPAPTELTTIAAELAKRGGWREATLDFSRLGSAPSYLFTAQGGREQVFGWAYQGARTATNVAALNGALETGAWGYALDTLDLLGADDVVLLKQDPALAQFSTLLEKQGFAAVWSGESLSLYHRDGGPRAFPVSADALGIGAGAQNFAALFPGLTVASSPQVDDFDPAYLARFRLVVLSRFTWRDQARAEAVVRAYAAQGGVVLVDLNGSPNDPLAREPHFLDVYGEQVRFSSDALAVTMNGKSQMLRPFADSEWQAVDPQGELQSTVTYDYHGVTGTALGFTPCGLGRIWFVGLNLPFHTLLTNDPVGLEILSQVISLPAGQPTARTSVPLQDYQANQDGYTFAYRVPAETELIVPVADHGGTDIRIDGQTVADHSLYNLVGFTAPAGQHQVAISFRPTAVYAEGALASLAGLVLGAAGLVFWKGGSHESH